MSTESMVTKRTVTFVNNRTPAEITECEIDLDKYYQDTEIVIEVKAASINPVDVFTHGLTYYYLASSSPKAYGKDYSGVIVRRGAKVDPKWQIGDKVNGMFHHIYGEQGTFSNYLVLDPNKQRMMTYMHPTQHAINQNEFVEPAAWPLVFGTAYNALFHWGQVWTPESRVLVHGASTAVGNAFIQLAKHQLNIGMVVGTCNSSSIAYNKGFGFDHLVAYNQEGSLAEHVKTLMKDQNIGKFDLILDCVGTQEFFPVIDELLKPRSENSYYLTTAGDHKFDYKDPKPLEMIPLKLPLRLFNPWRRFNYGFISVEQMPGPEFVELGARMVTQDKYHPKIDSVYKFDQFQEALDRLKSNKAKGKVVITM
ncbi:hypothetical protein NCAS_0D01050 [Naumovozyma castellii]|uniref:Enoyl reductase (ER) domain-containing protein n=1 Tax=Naumovozyma castellii TaxID=27288 RepID=G0VDP8_NAUCA|nr:hypothetical protein NCAS_0D01050 [Naumovozyma castellii CBS 4309]CCC69686.1 hypothetical protein NCAS_0D01050 [Naumovozyma castellii CBS 4309]